MKKRKVRISQDHTVEIEVTKSNGKYKIYVPECGANLKAKSKDLINAAVILFYTLRHVRSHPFRY